MRKRTRKSVFIVVVTIAALGALPRARAAERVTLRNGFVQLCDHDGQVDGRVRLYLSPGEDNYIEFAPDQIAAIEFVPDPPAPAPENANPGNSNMCNGPTNSSSAPHASPRVSKTNPRVPLRSAPQSEPAANNGSKPAFSASP